MRLVRMVICGFKSFATKTVFEPRGGICAIVGPNGCGKSNIIDAFLWALGEQRPAKLRASSMEEIIFAGTSKIPPASLAEVKLLFDAPELQKTLNSKKLLIIRRLHRDGTSEYILNDQHIRLKQLRQILAGTGLGSSIYSVIQQQRLDEILEVNGKKRRELLEEAAGVAGWRANRYEIVKKLKDAENILAEIEPQIDELRKRRKRLKRQATIAKKAKELAQKEHTIREKIISIRLIKIRNEMNRKLPIVESLNQKISEKQNKIQRLKIEETKINTMLASTSAELQKNEKEIEKLRQERERIKVEIGRCEERLRNILERLQYLNNTEEKKDQIQQIDKTIAELESELARLEETKKRYNKERASLKEELEEIESERATLIKEAEDLQRLLTETLSEAIASENQVTFLRRDIHHLKRSLKTAEEDVSSLTGQKRAAENLLSKIKEELDRTEKRITALRREVEQKKRVFHSLRRRISSLERRVEEIRVLRARIKGECEGLERALSADKGAAEAERVIKSIKEAGYNAVSLAKFLTNGASISPSERTILVENRAPLLSLLRNIKPRLYLRFLLCEKTTPEEALQILSSIWPNRGSEEETLSSGGHYGKLRVIDRLVEFIGEQAAYGEQLSRLQQLSEKISSLHQREEELKTRLTDLTPIGKTIQESLRSLCGQLNELEEKQRDLLRQESEATERVKHLERESRNLSEQISSLKEEITNSEKQVELHQRKVEQLREYQEKTRKKLHRLKEKIAILDRKREELQRRWRKMESDFSVTNTKLENTVDKINVLKEERKQKLKRKEREEREKEEHENQRENLLKNLEKLRKKLLTVEQELAQTVQIRTTKEKERENLLSRLREIRKEYENLSKEVEELRNEERSAATSVAEHRAQMKEIQKRAEEENLKILEDVKEGYEELVKELESVTTAIRRLGPVNEGAEQELEEVEGNLLFLEGQKSDIEEAVEKLHNVINELDMEYKKRLMSAFEALRENFGRVFRKIFGGGRADVRLVGEDLYESQLEVTASPPGKESTRMHLLSGGERALCAIAFLFALHLSHPTPVCFLDEIDAPLDDTNTKKLIRLLRQLSESTQFIIVTHNKITMSAADSLIGVTMQKSNRSELLSVQLLDEKKREKRVA